MVTLLTLTSVHWAERTTETKRVNLFLYVRSLLGFFIVLLRFFYMKDVKTLLSANEEMHKGHLFIAKLTHRLVYFSLIMLPTTGLLIAGILAADIPGMQLAIAVHELSAFLSYVTIAIHVGASLYSRFKGEGVWNGMVPVWKETGKRSSSLISKLEEVENKFYDEIDDRLIK